MKILTKIALQDYANLGRGRADTDSDYKQSEGRAANDYKDDSSKGKERACEETARFQGRMRIAHLFSGAGRTVIGTDCGSVAYYGK